LLGISPYRKKLSVKVERKSDKGDEISEKIGKGSWLKEKGVL
jgi:hypothetical protein